LAGKHELARNTKQHFYRNTKSPEANWQDK
jgi:hypothetical protein